MSPSVLALTFDRPVAVIGDIHGCADALRRLLAYLPADMPIVCCGDLCDRGPHTAGVIDQLVSRGAYSVMGNHEEWFVRWATGGGFDEMALNPMMAGRATLRSYGVEGTEVCGVKRQPTCREIEAQSWRVPAAHRDWLATLPLAIDLTAMGQSYWVVHAGIGPSTSLAGLTPAQVVPYLAEHKPASLLWPLNGINDVVPVDRPVLFGHKVHRVVRDVGHAVALDTGCGFRDGRLSCMILPERRVVSVAAEVR